MGKIMVITERHPEDKTGLPPGPWHDEPDKLQWYDPATGMACLIVRGPVGALCGYVGVEADHPWHGVGYNGCVEPACEGDGYGWHYECTPGGRTEVHGGLTYSASCSDGAPKVCHVPGAGRPDDVWWFGFDCSHYMDLIPRTIELYRQAGLTLTEEVYRDVDYVRGEVERLAGQLAAVA